MTSFNERLRAAMLSDAEAAENKRLRAAPATAPEFPADWAQMIHYPECWDTAAYPELRDAIHEALAWSGCSVCKPATAPSWHDAPEGHGMWVVRDGRGWGIINVASKIGDGWKKPDTRYFGPLPGDKP